MKNKPSKQEELKQLLDYIEFLKKRLASQNFRQNESSEMVQKTQKKYDGAKLRLRLLKESM